MKKSSSQIRAKGVQDPGHPAVQQPEKAGWIRKFCGRGIFRELWRNRFVVLRGDHLYISDKEVKDERKAQEVLDLADYERSEELRKAKSRSKKNHSRFTLMRCRRPGNNVPNLVFLAVSPEEKESWVHALNVAIVKAKNRVLDEVTIDEGGALAHPTRDRVKIPQGRRLPTRGHLLSVASTSSRGMLTLDLVTEEDSYSLDYDDDSCFRVDLQRGGADGWREVGGRRRAGTDVSKLRTASKETKVKTASLPRGSGWCCSKASQLDVWRVQNQQVQVLQAQSRTPQPGKRSSSTQGRSRCASMDEVMSSRPAIVRSELRRCPTEEEAVGGACQQPVGGASPPPQQPVGQLQSLIAQRMQRAQELLEEMRLQELQKTKAERERGGSSSHLKNVGSPRLHHLRGCESPHCSRSPGSVRSRSSESPRLRTKESPRPRGRESPRAKAKKNRCKASESPRARRPHSPAAKANASPRAKDSPRLASGASSRPNASDPVRGSASAPGKHESSAQKSPESPARAEDGGGGGSSQVHATDSRRRDDEDDSGHVTSSHESPRQSHGVAGLPASQDVTPDTPTPPSLASAAETERRRAEAERLLEEAVSSWREAQEVLQEVKELQSQTLRRQRRRTYEKMASSTTTPATEEEDTPTPMTSPENDGDESETP